MQSRLTLYVAACVGLVSCAPSESAHEYLQRRAGIDVCAAVKIAEPSRPKDTWDVSHFVFHIEGQCKARFLRSVYAASAGECEAMLPKNGSCIYFGSGKPSVVVNRKATGDDFEITTY